jgi:ribulose 1,5-bisphosphate synthetase/thiazole synthase
MHLPLPKRFLTLLAALLLWQAALAQPRKVITTDVCVYGGVAAGVIGAYTTTQYGKTALLVEPTAHLGGMTSSGLGATDIGNKFAITGVSKDFYRRMGQHYGEFEQWLFEPHVAEGILDDFAKRGGFPVYKQHRLLAVRKVGNKISEIDLERTDRPGRVALTIKAKMWLDCSYEGDLMAKAGVDYTVGREANTEFTETLNGVQLQDKHQFPDGIDPYVKEGDPKSGLLWGISDKTVEPNGTGDKKVQAYNYRICLSTDPANQIPFAKPAGYDASHYALLGRLVNKAKYKDVKNFMIINGLPGQKTDINHKGGFSLDMIGENWDYPEANHQQREVIAAKHANYIKGLFYYLANDQSLPSETRTSMQRYGYPKDEFQENGGFPRQMYVREARRMRGLLTMTQAHCQAKEVVEDGVGLAAYQMDSHNCQRIVTNGMVKNEGNVEVDLGSRPYPIAYRSIVAKEEQASNLLVPVCMSATHIAYGSIRMEPVFMVLAQSAAVAATMAIDKKQSVQQVDVKALQAELLSNPLANRTVPEVLADDNIPGSFKPIVGTWTSETKAGNKYGLSYQSATDTTSGIMAEAEFTAPIKYSGKYSVYYFQTGLVKGQSYTQLAKEAQLDITHADGKATLTFLHNENLGEWHKAGTYQFKAGTCATIKVKAISKGILNADAVLLVPEK